VTTRYRCTACGNLTRFDVVETTSVRAFHHYTVGGDLSIEEPEVIKHSVESVTCRWCGHGRGVEPLIESSDV
jgi:DNA-directed RNA polymerase subunit RPC12/RpoP